MQKNVLEYLEELLLKGFGPKPAIIDGQVILTFSDVSARAKAGAMLIFDRAPETKNEPVAVFLPKSSRALIAQLAALYSGNFYVPLDVSSPPARLRSVLENLKPAFVLTSPELRPFLVQAGMNEDRILVLSDEAPAVEADEQRIRRFWDGLIDTDPVYTIYTSGSTGTPKGVVIAHRGVIDYINWARACFRIDESAVIGSQSPFYFDNSTLDIYLCLAAGATLVLIPEQLFSFPARLLPFLVEQRVNFIFWGPFRHGEHREPESARRHSAARTEPDPVRGRGNAGTAPELLAVVFSRRPLRKPLRPNGDNG